MVEVFTDLLMEASWFKMLRLCYAVHLLHLCLATRAAGGTAVLLRHPTWPVPCAMALMSCQPHAIRWRHSMTPLQVSSIFAASAILSLGGVATSPGVPPNHKAIWFNALAQVGGQDW